MQFAEQVLKLLQPHSHFRRQFRLRGDAAQAQLQIAVGLFDAAGLAPQVPRTPIHFAKAVQDGATNAKLGIGFQLNVFAGIEFLDGVDQANHARVNQVLQRDLRRQPVVNPPGHVPHLRQMLQQQSLAFLGDLLNRAALACALPW